MRPMLLSQQSCSCSFHRQYLTFLACVCCPDAHRIICDISAHDLQPSPRFRSSSAELPDRMSRTMLPPGKVVLLRRLKHAEGPAATSWEAVNMQSEGLLHEVPPMLPSTRTLQGSALFIQRATVAGDRPLSWVHHQRPGPQSKIAGRPADEAIDIDECALYGSFNAGTWVSLILRACVSGN